MIAGFKPAFAWLKCAWQGGGAELAEGTCIGAGECAGVPRTTRGGIAWVWGRFCAGVRWGGPSCARKRSAGLSPRLQTSFINIPCKVGKLFLTSPERGGACRRRWGLATTPHPGASRLCARPVSVGWGSHGCPRVIAETATRFRGALLSLEFFTWETLARVGVGVGSERPAQPPRLAARGAGARPRAQL